jgi:HPt (histidine-containing phosphotransfer) domain-containing protein
VADEDRRLQLSARLEDLRRGFTANLPSRLLALRSGVLATLEGGEPATGRWSALRGEAHRLAGAGTTFGHPAVTLAAAEVERCIGNIEKIETNQVAWPPGLVAALREAAIALGGLAGTGVEETPVERPEPGA